MSQMENPEFVEFNLVIPNGRMYTASHRRIAVRPENVIGVLERAGGTSGIELESGAMYEVAGEYNKILDLIKSSSRTIRKASQ